MDKEYTDNRYTDLSCNHKQSTTRIGFWVHTTHSSQKTNTSSSILQVNRMTVIVLLSSTLYRAHLMMLSKLKMRCKDMTYAIETSFVAVQIIYEL